MVAAVLVVTVWTALVLAFTPTSALDRLPAGRSSAYPGSIVLAVLMIAGGAVAAAGAAWCLREVYPASWEMTDRAETTAYVGGALGWWPPRREPSRCCSCSARPRRVPRDVSRHPQALAPDTVHHR
ncbi:hypothetical protein NKG05_07725 [Oerskovia sp. M15]